MLQSDCRTWITSSLSQKDSDNTYVLHTFQTAPQPVKQGMKFELTVGDKVAHCLCQVQLHLGAKAQTVIISAHGHVIVFIEKVIYHKHSNSKTKPEYTVTVAI